jgi:very-short-patch-repair endonuclease
MANIIGYLHFAKFCSIKLLQILVILKYQIKIFYQHLNFNTMIATYSSVKSGFTAPLTNETQLKSLGAHLLWRELKHKDYQHWKFKKNHKLAYFTMMFYSPVLNLAIEVDNTEVYNQRDVEAIRYRDNYLKQFGIQVLRLKEEEVMHRLPAVLYMIMSYDNN